MNGAHLCLSIHCLSFYSEMMPGGHEIISDFVFPTMTWKAGRTNAIARAACCTCLAVLVDRAIISVRNISASLKEDIISRAMALSRDECQETQRAIVRITRHMIVSSPGMIRTL